MTEALLERRPMAEMLERLPMSMRALRRDKRGLPVPWFVDLRAPYIDGNPDFRVMDGKHFKVAMREHRCWVCGWLMRDWPTAAFVAGPMCGINRTTAEPPCHVECARWSAMACPFLSNPKRVRDDTNLPADRQMAGKGIMRNPGVAMVWVGKGYEVFRVTNGVLIQMPEPDAVEWYAQGRLATRAEVLESIATGLPLLEEAAARDGAEGIAEMHRMAERFQQYVPA